jgi:DsbC/DsbD-like thiol-disulfide interchange protein
MSSIAHLATLLGAMLVGLAPTTAASDAASEWSHGFHSRVRLVSGGGDDGKRLAGIEIVLDDGFKTYWRNPGDSGLPPRFDWDGSQNAEPIKVEWPAPERSTDAAGVAYGYHDRVLFPVVLAPESAGSPTTLKLAVEYGVCKEICIPARADLVLRFGDDDREHRDAIDDARSSVPRPRPLDSDEPLSIRSVRPVAGLVPTFEVDVAVPAGTDPALFAEAPDGWFAATSEPDSQQRFRLTLEEKPKDAKGTVPLLLTLVADGQAIETRVDLDAGAAAR